MQVEKRLPSLQKSIKVVREIWGKGERPGEKSLREFSQHGRSSLKHKNPPGHLKVTHVFLKASCHGWSCRVFPQLAGGAEPCLLGKTVTSGVTPVGAPRFALVVAKGIWISWFGPEEVQIAL